MPKIKKFNIDTGTSVNQIVVLEDVGGGTPGLPAVDGSQLTGIVGTGTSDHGALSGLADDDHSQYHTDARGDARYTPIAHAGQTNNPHTVTAAQVGAYTTAAADAAFAPIAHASATNNPHTVTKAQLSLENVENIKHNRTATTDPGATDDDSEGYTVGSSWINTSSGAAWLLVDAATNNANWILFGISSAAVTSFNGRTGAISPEDGDYTGTVQDQIIRSENLTSNASGAAGVFSFSAGGVPKTTKRWIVSGNITGSLSTPTGIPTLSTGQSMDLEFTLQQDATGGHSVSNTLFAGSGFVLLGAHPVFATGANEITRIVMTAFHNGTSVIFYVYGEQFVALDSNNTLTKSPKFWVGTTANLPSSPDANTIYMTTD